MIAAILRDNLMNLARTYKRAAKVPRMSQVSYQFYGRNSFFEQFAKGKCTISIDKYEEVVRKFVEAWPEGHSIPFLDGIDAGTYFQ